MTTPTQSAPVPPEPVSVTPVPLPPQPASWLARTEQAQKYVLQHPWKALGILLAVSVAATLVLPKVKHA